jgi:hypothetical protein
MDEPQQMLVTHYDREIPSLLSQYSLPIPSSPTRILPEATSSIGVPVRVHSLTHMHACNCN